jgi:hypothetical protein
MPRHDLMNFVLSLFEDGQSLTMEQIIKRVRDERGDILTVTEIKSAVLALLRREDLAFSPSFGLLRSTQPVAA